MTIKRLEKAEANFVQVFPSGRLTYARRVPTNYRTRT